MQALLRLCVVACLIVCARCSTSGPVVDIPDLGRVEGGTETVNGTAVEVFLGLEYATAKRFQPPVPQKPWSGTRHAKSFGPTCHGSQCYADDVLYESEQCLFLNVYRAAGVNASHPVPLLVYLHGGGYEKGCSNMYSGQGLAASSGGSVVVVTFNYRLNLFGFLGHSTLRSGDNSTGNWGLQDQRAALVWLQQHAAAFGGDPARVTIFGQSAGAGSVSCHLTAPLSRGQGLYHKAIAQSALAPTWAANSMTLSESNYAKVLTYSLCVDAECLRLLPAAELANVAKLVTKPLRMDHSLTWAPVIDGVEFTQQPWQYIQAGDFEAVDIMAGTTRDEMAYFLWDVPDMTEAVFDESVVDALKSPPAGLAEVRALYAESAYDYPAYRGDHNYWWWATQSALTDSIMTCQNRRALRWVAEAKPNITLYSYFMAHATQSLTMLTGMDGPGSACAPHMEEIPYVFDCRGYPLQSSCGWSREDEAQLAHDLSQFWVSFAVKGHPGGSWEAFNATADRTFVFDTAVQYAGSGFYYVDHLRTAACDFWDTQLYP
eukprot:TRINITY_DN36496_c0_g1_i1.p1 TRINITY_DN36496_c0_g1~~TRINITY_DN36496_c0_g1_i1.p1  ORF type:complete len:559 (+),score=136.51 TRINITY_DN36496_c0_g1_i1:47-1678(+)